MWEAYFCMGAYKRDVVVIEMGAYIHGVLILCECLLSQFYSIWLLQLHDDPDSLLCKFDECYVGKEFMQWELILDKLG